MDSARIRREFPLAGEYVYLASAASGILPERSRLFLEEHFREGIYLRQTHNDLLDVVGSCRAAAARLFGGGERNWALMPNTSHGLNAVAGLVSWHEGDSIALADCEFPANVFPWKNLTSRGVRLRWAHATESKARSELLEAACDESTRLVAVSGVQFHNGYQPDLRRLAAFCRERDMWLCVDGIQGLGNRDWNLPELGIDFLAAGGQKWLLAPRGTGLLYVSDRALEAINSGELEQSALGWLNGEKWDFTNILNYDLPLSREARRLEIGTYHFHGFDALRLSLELFGEIGLAQVQEHSDGLMAAFLDKLRSAGLKAELPPSSEGEPSGRCSQIVQLACADPSALFRHLLTGNIVTTPREGGLRVAFHLYNNEDDVDRLIDALAGFQVHGSS